jgi:hypothetical protein
LFPVNHPRNESQHFRPAGTRVALPGTNRRSSEVESGLQDFLASCISSRSERKLREIFVQRHRDEAAVEILRESLPAAGRLIGFIQDDKNNPARKP